LSGQPDISREGIDPASIPKCGGFSTPQDENAVLLRFEMTLLSSCSEHLVEVEMALLSHCSEHSVEVEITLLSMPKMTFLSMPKWHFLDDRVRASVERTFSWMDVREASS
jgi:hypothetical protein